MNILFRSTTDDPFRRGEEFGSRFKDKIRENIASYTALFERHAAGPVDLVTAGRAALEETRSFAPLLYEEMLGLASGSGLNVELIGALNARTEILAASKARLKGECSAIIHLHPTLEAPVAMQTWDWYKAFEDRWLVWEIPQADGSVTRTMTEYGIVGKAGMNTRGIGLLFTILHHRDDGQRIGLPVHVAARAVLDGARDVYHAAQLLAQAKVSASSSINLAGFENGLGKAMSVELYPGGPGFILPDQDGFIVHTNHFLAPEPASADTEPKAFPDTLLRRDLLLRQLRAEPNPTTADLLAMVERHRGGDGAVFCVAEAGTDPGEAYETLSTVILDLERGELRVLKGGPRGQDPIA
jgi:isopenicillin-N N-acyltransferase-like protein